MNRQQVLPLLQALALPLYWLAGRWIFGLGTGTGALFMVTAPFAAHAVVVGVGFVVSYLNQHEQRGVRHGRRRDWLLAYVREAGESIRQFYWLMPFREGFRVPQPLAPLQELPIILVHGYGCNRGLWLPAARWFSRRGYPVSAISLQPAHCPIEDYTGAVAAEIERVRAETGAARVALIGHSMGGLVARAYLRRCAEQGQDPLLAALVTLGTPHRGTHIARIGRGENARQMRYGARWLDQLDPAGGATPGSSATSAVTGTATTRGATTPVTTIASLQDNIVSRPREQRLGLPGSRAIFVKRQGHMSLATSTRVLRVVDRVLRRSCEAAGAAEKVTQQRS